MKALRYIPIEEEIDVNIIDMRLVFIGNVPPELEQYDLPFDDGDPYPALIISNIEELKLNMGEMINIAGCDWKIVHEMTAVCYNMTYEEALIWYDKYIKNGDE